MEQSSGQVSHSERDRANNPLNSGISKSAREWPGVRSKDSPKFNTEHCLAIIRTRTNQRTNALLWESSRDLQATTFSSSPAAVRVASRSLCVWITLCGSTRPVQVTTYIAKHINSPFLYNSCACDYIIIIRRRQRRRTTWISEFCEFPNYII